MGNKLGPRYIGLFRVIERVGRSVYKFNFPNYWKIYPIININYLELVGKIDPYGRQLLSLTPIMGIDYPATIVNEKKEKFGIKYLVRYDRTGREFDR